MWSFYMNYSLNLQKTCYIVTYIVIGIMNYLYWNMIFWSYRTALPDWSEITCLNQYRMAVLELLEMARPCWTDKAYTQIIIRKTYRTFTRRVHVCVCLASYLRAWGGFLHLCRHHLALGHACRLFAAELDVAIRGILPELPRAVRTLDVVWVTDNNRTEVKHMSGTYERHTSPIAQINHCGADI